MINKIVLLSVLFTLTACGGGSNETTSSGGDKAPVATSSGSNNENSGVCVVKDNKITVAKGASCKLTDKIVKDYSLASLSVSADSSFECDTDGKGKLGNFTSGDGNISLNNLELTCS